ncbi:MAG: cyclic nucleotide-binding domain-containing protein [Chloroflexi bacterium]|nr:cyclic nucleotide-binding domain-containing protein [Chloroflexota bacterium]
MTDDIQGDPLPADNPTDDPSSILSKLRNLTLFTLLTDEQFRLVIGLLRTEHVAQGALLLDQGGTNTNMYILRRGRAAVRFIDTRELERLGGFLNVGAIFNENSFLTGARNDRSVEAVNDLTVWYIPRADFSALLDKSPDIEANLAYPMSQDAAAPKLVRDERSFSWQRQGESIVLFRKKHPIVFLQTLWPVLGLLILVIIILLPPVHAVLQPAQNWLFAVIGLLSIVWVALQLIDWQNDYYAVTDQRILHRERVLFIRDEQDELPVSRIQDVRVDRPNFFSFMFDIGNVTIEASGTRSRVRFEDISHPDDISAQINKLLSYVRAESHAAQRAKIRYDLRKELGLASTPPPAEPAPPKAQPKKARRNGWRGFVAALRGTFIPHMRLVRGDAIIYRKHWLRLLEVVSIPLTLTLLLAGALVLVRLVSPDISELVFFPPLVFVIILVGIGLMGWLVYRYEDWRNDIYILLPDRLVDITASPFGLRGTSRREAKLGAVQNVSAATRGVLDNAFNMGDVIILTAAGEGKLNFERVYNPRQVQRDIVDRVDAFEMSQRERQAAQRRREMTEWLGIYDELTRMHDREKLV